MTVAAKAGVSERVVFQTHTLFPEDVAEFVSKLQAASGQPITYDHHPAVPLILITTTGDLEAVRKALIALEPWHEATYKNAYRLRYGMEAPPSGIPRLRS
ncbi:MAG: hypothetical protein ACM3NH_04680 [Candidatus Saccharibacteria bacterium]